MSVKLTEIIFLLWDLLIVETERLNNCHVPRLPWVVWGRDFVQSAEKLGGAGSEARAEYVSFDATE